MAGHAGRCPSGQREQTVNLPAYAYGGSNPSRPTRALRALALALLLVVLSACAAKEPPAHLVRETAEVAAALSADPKLGTVTAIDQYGVVSDEGSLVKADRAQTPIGYERTLQFTPPPGVLVEQWADLVVANLTAQGFKAEKELSLTSDPRSLTVDAARGETEVSLFAYVSALRIRVSIVSTEPGY